MQMLQARGVTAKPSGAHHALNAGANTPRVPFTCVLDPCQPQLRLRTPRPAHELAASASAQTPASAALSPVSTVLEAYVTSPATKSKLMRLKLDDLKTICAKLGITEKSKKADYTAAIMDALAVPRYPAATVDAAALQRHASSHPSATPKASSLDAYHGSGDDEEHDTMPHAASETSGENVLGTSVDHADRSWDEGSVWSDEGDGSGDDDVWGPGRGASELDPGAVERARLAMQAALEGTTDSDMHYVDPLASTARSTSMSPRSGPQMHAEDARQSWTHRAAAGSIERQAKYMHSRVQDHVSGNPTGVSVTWLGTSSGAPTRTRNNSGIALRATSGGRDDIMLVDTGEGTLTQLADVGLEPTQVQAVCITHHHGDHCFGLPALVQARHELQLERDGFATPLHVFGPPGTARLVCASVRSGHIPAEGYPAPPPMHVNVTEWALGSGPSPAATRVERPGAEFEITQRNPDQAAGAAPLGVKEIRNFAFCRQPGTSGRREDTKFLLYNGLSWTVQLPNGWTLATAQLRHRVPCWGYVFLEPAGNDGRRRRKVCLLGDTCDSRAIRPLAMGCDLLSHESTFLDTKRDKARIAAHSTGRQAGDFAAAVRARQLVLTHFSGRYQAASVAPAAAPTEAEDEEQAASLSLLQREAQGAVRGPPVACAFDGFTWRVARPGEPGGGVRDRWAAQSSLHRTHKQ